MFENYNRACKDKSDSFDAAMSAKHNGVCFVKMPDTIVTKINFFIHHDNTWQTFVLYVPLYLAVDGLGALVWAMTDISV